MGLRPQLHPKLLTAQKHTGKQQANLPPRTKSQEALGETRASQHNFWVVGSKVMCS